MDIDVGNKNTKSWLGKRDAAFRASGPVQLEGGMWTWKGRKRLRLCLLLCFEKTANGSIMAK